MSLTERAQCPVKYREVTVKKKRVETFRNIRYGDGRIYLASEVSLLYPFRFEFVVNLHTFDIYYSERNIELI